MVLNEYKKTSGIGKKLSKPISITTQLNLKTKPEQYQDKDRDISMLKERPSRQGQHMVKASSRQSQGKIKVRSREVEGKVQVMSRQGKTKVNARSRQKQGNVKGGAIQGQSKGKARSRQRKPNLDHNYNLMDFDKIEINLVSVQVLVLV